MKMVLALHIPCSKFLLEKDCQFAVETDDDLGVTRTSQRNGIHWANRSLILGCLWAFYFIVASPRWQNPCGLYMHLSVGPLGLQAQHVCVSDKWSCSSTAALMVPVSCFTLGLSFYPCSTVDKEILVETLLAYFWHMSDSGALHWKLF